MKKIIDGFILNNSLPIKERQYYLSLFMSCIGSLVFVLLGLLIRVSVPIIGVAILLFCIFALLIHVQTKWPNLTLYTWLFLICVNYFGFPAVLLLTERKTIEIPIYFFLGITFGFILLEKMQRVLYLLFLMIIDYASIIVGFLFLATPDKIGTSSPIDFVRIAMAVLITSIMCGILIIFRNRYLSDQIDRSFEATEIAQNLSFAKDTFLVNVSHEIRTPLNAIIGTSDILLDSDNSNRIKEMAFNISNAGHALLSITSDMLDFSRMNADNVIVNNDYYIISDMLNDLINSISVRLIDTKVNFFVDINPLLPSRLYGDSQKIRQIISNLLSNAIKFTKEGHVILHVDFRYIDRETIVLSVNVEDTGIGISPDYIEKIFEPFRRSGSEKIDSEIEGNGLGLALCRKLSNAMGGKIDVSSEVSKGSSFVFEIEQKIEVPYIYGFCGGISDNDRKVVFYADGDREIKDIANILKVMDVECTEALSIDEFVEACQKRRHSYYMISSEAYESAKEDIKNSKVEWDRIVVISSFNNSFSGEPFKYVLTKPISCLNLSDLLNNNSSFSIRKHYAEGAFKIPKATILVIDDNLINLDVAENILKNYDANVITAISGKDGLMCLKEEEVDLVLLDYMMPEMDGIETMKAIRAMNERMEKLPIITLTANVVSGAREMFIDAGFDEYLTKPIEVSKLEKVLHRFLPEELLEFE